MTAGNKIVVSVGWRHDSGYHLFDYLCEANDNVILVEIYKKNVDVFDTDKYDNLQIVHADVCEYIDDIPEGDVIIWQHGPEHVAKELCIDVIEKMKEKFDAVILECPEGKYSQGSMYGNKWENHVSTWKQEDFEELGFNTRKIGTRGIIGYYKK